MRTIRTMTVEADPTTRAASQPMVAWDPDIQRVQDARPQEDFIDKILVKAGGRVTFLPVEELDWVEAAGNYLCLHRQRETHLIRKTMHDFEASLDPQKFLRIHRCTIVNMERIKAMQPIFHGDYAVQLHDGTQLTLTRNYRTKAAAVLGRVL